jgi:phosphoenolpyruvate carboxylase
MSRAQFEEKDQPLRRDVSRLGALVGDVITEQAGEGLFRRVEAARRAAIRRRAEVERVEEAEDGSGNAAEGEGAAELARLLEDLDDEDAVELVRAFTTYFRLVNLAEQIHRIRRRRQYLREGTPQPGSLLDALGRLRESGLDGAAARELFSDLAFEPVFTAHPTEATRPAVLFQEQEIARLLVEGLDPSLTPPEWQALEEQLRTAVTLIWQTEESPASGPRVVDELEHVLFYLSRVLYRIVPPFYEELERAFREVYGGEPWAPEDLPTVLRFASWVGGDMDGHPGVTPETFEAALARQRRTVLGLYRRELEGLAERSGQSASRITVDPEIPARTHRYAAYFHDRWEALSERSRDMPYRLLLTLMAWRVEAALAGEPTGYRDADELSADLHAVAASLAAHGGEHAGRFRVLRLATRVRTFGFHMATLDLRQDAGVHRRVAGRLLGDPEWLERSPAARAERLREALGSGAPPADLPAADAHDADVLEETERILDGFRALGRAREAYGKRAAGLYVVSMSRDVDDVLTVLLLARWAGLADEAGGTPVDVAPLFETVPDLQAARRVFDELLRDPIYRRHLAERGDRQTVMVGYSDSSKRGGLAASRWALQQAQEELVRLFRGSGVGLTFFHGRGGTVSRGGGKTHWAVMAAPRGAVAGRLRMTEQGEVIDDKYGLRGIALRTLERTVGAVARATAGDVAEDPRTQLWRRVMDDVAKTSRAVFRELVYDDPEFVEYFRNATPVDVVERMRIGSRPASRKKDGGIESLRAIPWVFAWTQSRHLLPGWYGLGSGLEAAAGAHGVETLMEMTRSWPFFTTLVADAEMVLAKSDLDVARRYAALAGDLAERFFPQIETEHRRTVRWLLRLREADELLAADPWLARSIRLRNPYVDPMSWLQVDLLERWRAGQREDDDLLHALMATVQGIAQGLKNTG